MRERKPLKERLQIGLFLSAGLVALLFFMCPATAAAEAALSATSTPTPFLPVLPESTLPAPAENTSSEIPPVVEMAMMEEEDSPLSNWPQEIQAVAEFIVKAAREWGLKPAEVAAVAWKETGSWYNCPDGPITASCTGNASEIGPMQVKGFHFETWENPRDLETNFRVGARVLSEAMADADGNFCLALAAYNRGPYGRFWEDPLGLQYADEALAIFERFVGHPHPCTK